MRWTAEEDRELGEAVAQRGYRWRAVSADFSGRRSATSVRLRWYQIAGTSAAGSAKPLLNVGSEAARTHQGALVGRSARWTPYRIPQRDRKGEGENKLVGKKGGESEIVRCRALAQSTTGRPTLFLLFQ